MKVAPLETVLLSLESGARPKGGVSADSGEIPSLGGEHVNSDGGFDFTSIKRIPRSFFATMRGGRIAQSDILIVKDGATTGKTSLVREDFPFAEAAVNEHVFCVRVDQAKASPGYVYHFLRSARGQKAILLDFRGATVGGISREFATKTRLPLPPLEEQRRIAEVLDRADSLRAKRRATLTQLYSLTQSIFLDLFGDPVANPKDWPTLRLQDVLSIPLRNGRSPSNTGSVKAKVLTLSAITGSEFDATALKTSTFNAKPPADQSVDELDFLICRGNGNVRLVGKGYFPQTQMVDVTFPDTMIAARVSPERLERSFLQYIWNSSAVRRQVESLARTTNGTFKVNQTMLEEITFCEPPIALQREFARRVTAVEKMKTAQRASLAELDALFASLQHRAFRGES